MKTVQHTLKTPYRWFTVWITEHPDYVDVKVEISKYGDFGDTDQIRSWFESLIDPYDDDPRPIKCVHLLSGEQAEVHSTFTIITPGPPSSRN